MQEIADQVRDDCKGVNVVIVAKHSPERTARTHPDMQCRVFILPRQTSIQILHQGFLVQVLADEDELLHAVTIGVVPVATKGGFTIHHHGQLVGGHGGKPQACIAQLHLLACLLEDVAVVHLVLEVADG